MNENFMKIWQYKLLFILFPQFFFRIYICKRIRLGGSEIALQKNKFCRGHRRKSNILIRFSFRCLEMVELIITRIYKSSCNFLCT